MKYRILILFLLPLLTVFVYSAPVKKELKQDPVFFASLDDYDHVMKIDYALVTEATIGFSILESEASVGSYLLYTSPSLRRIFVRYAPRGNIR